MRVPNPKREWRRNRRAQDAEIERRLKRTKNEEIGRKAFARNRARWIRIHQKFHVNGKTGERCHLCHVGPVQAQLIIDAFYGGRNQ